MKRSVFILFVFQLFIMTQSTVKASDSLTLFNNLRLNGKVAYGYVYPHQGSIKYSLQENIQGLEITLTTQTYGRTFWDQLYRYPRLGIGYLYTSLGNHEVFGSANSIFLFTEVPFLSKDRRFQCSYQINMGVAYVTRQFSLEKNPMNLAISSALNVHVGAEFSARYRITRRNEIKTGIELTHFSNGKTNSPNLGLNSVKYFIGLNYLIPSTSHARIIYEMPAKQTSQTIDMVWSGGSKTDDQISGKHYFISTLVADYCFHLNPRYGFGAGADFFYDESLGNNKVYDLGGTYSTSDLYQFALHGGFHVQYSRLNILIEIGDYVVANYYKYSSVFSRIGFRYQLYENLHFNLTLKSHYAIADYIEWGIGYRFHLAKKVVK